MTEKRFKVSIIYFVVVVLTLLMRVASALDIYSALGIDDADAFWSFSIQIVIFGVVPFVLYTIFVAGREDRFLPYLAIGKKKSEELENSDEPAEIFEDKELETAVEPQATLSEEDDLQDQVSPKCEKPETKGRKAIRLICATFSDFGFKKVSAKSALATIPLAICMIIIGSGVSMLWQIVLSLTGYTHTSSNTDYYSIAILFKELFFVAVLPGFFEEFTHRGLLGAGYRETGWKFVVMSALLFGLMHQNIVQTGYTFVDGIAMALVLYYTGSIFPAMFMHFLNNAVSVCLGYIEQNGGVFGFVNTFEDWLYSTFGGLIVCILAILISAVIVVLIFYAMRKEAVKQGRIDDAPFKKTDALPIKYDLVFMLTVIVGVAATVFSLVWGIMR